MVGKGVSVYTFGPKYNPSVYGCLDATGKAMRLKAPPGPYLFGEVFDSVTLPEVDSPLVAYAWQINRTDSTTGGVAVLNLRTGRIVRSATAVEPEETLYSSVSSLKLGADASIAWIGEGIDDAEEEPPYKRQVEKIAANGEFAILDEGPKIAPRSLKVRGPWVSWLNSGHLRRNRLGSSAGA